MITNERLEQMRESELAVVRRAQVPNVRAIAQEYADAIQELIERRLGDQKTAIERSAIPVYTPAQIQRLAHAVSETGASPEVINVSEAEMWGTR